MRLARVRLRNIGPFADTTLSLAREDAEGLVTPRPAVVFFGGDGTGKTSLVTALASTRPGYAVPQFPTPGGKTRETDAPSACITEWQLGDDDDERPHPLVVASPSAVLDGEALDESIARRREQALFDKRAQTEGGFVFVAFSGARWFSRQAGSLTMPERSVLRWDVRQPASFDDPTRADLARDTKQCLAYASVARALSEGRPEHAHLARLDAALHEVVNVMLSPFGLRYAGTSPLTLEPEARDDTGRIIPFDALPRAARHFVAFGALTVRALFAAYPGVTSPRESEGVVAIDDVESQQDPAMLRVVVPLLRRALPNVQWILTTASTQLALACDAGDVIALRRSPASSTGVDVGEDVLH